MVRQQLSDDELIAAYIVVDPSGLEPDRTRLDETGLSVWALAGYLRSSGDDVVAAAREYGLPVPAVEAALAWYERHRDSIDARLDANLLVDGNDATVPLRA